MRKAQARANDQAPSPFLRKAFQVAILVILNCLLFLPSLGYDFTGLDDTRLIVQRADYLKQPSTIVEAFGREPFYSPTSPQDVVNVYYRPLLTISFMWDAALGGPHPFTYHLTNILLHLINSILVLFLLNSLAIPPLASFWGASVFAVHPLLAQAVAWIPGRNDSLLGLFLFSSMIFFIRFLRTSKPADLLLHVLFFGLGLFSKESAIAVPLIALAYCWAYGNLPAYKAGCAGTFSIEKRQIRRGWQWTVGLYLIVLAIWVPLRAAVVEQSKADLSAFTLLGFFILNLPLYFQVLQKLVVPLNLSSLSTPQDTDYSLLLIALLMLGALFFSSRRVSWKRAAFGFLWFNAFLLPAFLVHTLTGLEHRVYVPMVGFLVMILQMDLFKGLSLKRSNGLYMSVTFLALIFILNLSHVGSFQNGFEFWKQAAKNSPRSSLAKLNYGARLIEHGKPEEALKALQEGILINSLEPKLHNNIGVIFARAGKQDLAEEEFKKEIELNPGYSDAYFNLGVLYGEKGDWPGMEDMWRKTLAIDPHHERAKTFLTDYLNKRRSIQQTLAP